MTRTRSASHREGFTLVELLTVIGIISLLISILLPSLSKARDQAKKVSCKAELDAIGKGLEMFQNDFSQYPDSSVGQDPIDWNTTWPSTNTLTVPPNNAMMTGAHWMARAMIGHDFQGVDTNGVMLKRKPNSPPAGYVAPTLDSFLSSTVPPGVNSERKGTGYVDPKVFVRDDDPIKFPGSTLGDGKNSPTIGRIVVSDVYNFPVLYYRANSRAQNPFDIGTLNTTTNTGSSKGVYCQLDNGTWTGSDQATVQASYDFAASGAAHGIGKFIESGTGLTGVPGDYTGTNLPKLDLNASGNDSAGKAYKGKTFASYLHSEATHTAGNAATAVNPESFILLSAGKDGVFGTSDDVNNFTGGL